MDPSLCNTEAKKPSDKQHLYMERAAKVATKSTMTHRHGCVVVASDGSVFEGYNHHGVYMSHRFSIHAEIHALYKAKKYQYPLTEMYVVRINKGGTLKYSRPCSGCQLEILKFGIPKVYFSTNTP
jgi:tRNA(Arg) A34 adenosine deaminase TadA